MFLSYLKSNGRLVPPMLTSNIKLTLSDVWGEEKAEEYSLIYGFINVPDDLNVLHNPGWYYVDTETKELKLKQL